MKWIKVKNKTEMACIAADILCAQVLLKPESVLGLATGSTPLCVYENMVKRYQEKKISFADSKTVNLDEYYGIQPSDEQSYRYYMDTNLFHHIDIPPENAHVMNGMAKDADEECRRFTGLIHALGGIDMQLLGIGHNGHIGFNEPDDHFTMDTYCVTLSESTRKANAIYFKNGLSDMPEKALTMGIRPIMQARRVLLIAGADKKDILQAAFNGPVTPQVPASILQLHRRLTVVSCEE